MLSQLDKISYVVANSLARKLSGVDFSVPLEVVKIGYTVKGQPWISYVVGGKKCSQFVSRSLWNNSLKKHCFCMFQIGYSEGDGDLSSRVVLNFKATNPGNRVHTGVFSKNSGVFCSCKGFQYRHSCYHSEIYEFVGNQLFRPFSAGYIKIKDNCFVKTSSAPQPVVNEAADVVINKIDKPELNSELTVDNKPAPVVDLATQLWSSDRGKIVKTIGGVDMECVRVSLDESETIKGQANKEYEVVEIEFGQVLIKQVNDKIVEKKSISDPSKYSLPARILNAHKAAKEMIWNQKQPVNLKSYPEIDCFVAADIEWSKSSEGNLWQSTQGDTVEADFLKEVVRRQLLLGHNVKIATSKSLYTCFITEDGDVKNTQLVTR